MDDNDETVAASGGGGRQKGEFEESSRRSAVTLHGVSQSLLPLFSEIGSTIIGSQKTCLWTEHQTWWGGQTKGTTKKQNRVQY